jgi:hypothetical protein
MRRRDLHILANDVAELAKTLGIPVPSAMLSRADEVIE